LRVGDYFICSETTGHVSSLIDSYAKRLSSVLPSIPVLVAGFDELPQAGDYFEVVSKSDYLKARANNDSKQFSISHRALYENGINLLIKSDTHSSQEAIIDGLDRLSKKTPKGFNILRQDIGDINEGDIEFAFNTGAELVGFNVKMEMNASLLAVRRKVTVANYGIIYKLLEALETRSKELQPVELVRTKIGEAVVLRVFDIKKIGIIAGSIIKDGRFTREGYAMVWRGRKKIGEGKITSLQRDKKTVKEVFTGFECGILIDGLTDIHIDDRIECYIDMPKK
jgi:translation initiation factor IF-2